MNYSFTALPPANPCEPSPCGSHSICRVIGDRPTCSCQPDFVGAPPNCRPECVTSSECDQQAACINQKCRNPCEGTCGLGAECRVINHNPICSCSRGLIGDPFEQCVPERKWKLQQFFLQFIKMNVNNSLFINWNSVE